MNASKHIIYLKDQKPICEDPERLGSDFVISSVAFGRTCSDCNAILFTHNKNEFAREYNRDWARPSLTLVPPAEEKTPSQILVGAYPWVLVVILSILLVLESWR